MFYISNWENEYHVHVICEKESIVPGICAVIGHVVIEVSGSCSFIPSQNRPAASTEISDC